jgi:hypothetical protein
MSERKMSLLSAVLCGLLLYGCAAATTTSVNRDITTGIADAGVTAITAEQEYQAGTIPQTPTARTVINDLGDSYNQAKAAWLLVLNAENAYRTAQNQQIAACTPVTSGSVAANPGSAPIATANCTAATKSATAAQAQVTQTQTALNTTVATMSTQTASVKAITK